MVLIQPFAGPLVPRGTPNGLTHTQITSHGSEFRALFARNLFFCLYGLLEVGEAPSSSQSKSILPLALNMDMWKICSYIFQVCIYIYMCVCVLCIWICIYIYIYVYNVYVYMVVDQNSFIPERPFFANKNFTFAKLSRTPCLSFAGPMLANNTSYEDSFTTCQITPENHGSLLGSLLNMQLASRNPFSGQILLCKVYWPTPFNMHFDFRPLFRITFAELSRKYPYS